MSVPDARLPFASEHDVVERSIAAGNPDRTKAATGAARERARAS
jgi:hypothetical protein